MIVLYANIPQMVRHTGMDKVDPDHIHGDETAMFFLHDDIRGTFTYIDPVTVGNVERIKERT